MENQQFRLVDLEVYRLARELSSESWEIYKDLHWDGCKTILPINLGLFERDEEGQQKDLNRSRATLKIFWRQPDEVAAKKDKFRENIVLQPSQYITWNKKINLNLL